jgi:hypothetical protein
VRGSHDPVRRTLRARSGKTATECPVCGLPTTCAGNGTIPKRLAIRISRVGGRETTNVFRMVPSYRFRHDDTVVRGHETRAQHQMLWISNFGFRILDLEFPSDFDFRFSDFFDPLPAIDTSRLRDIVAPLRPASAPVHERFLSPAWVVRAADRVVE